MSNQTRPVSLLFVLVQILSFIRNTKGIYFDADQTYLLKHVDELRKRKMTMLNFNENHLNGDEEILLGEWDSNEHAEPNRRLKEIHSAFKKLVSVIESVESQMQKVKTFSLKINIFPVIPFDKT